MAVFMVFSKRSLWVCYMHCLIREEASTHLSDRTRNDGNEERNSNGYATIDDDCKNIGLCIV